MESQVRAPRIAPQTSRSRRNSSDDLHRTYSSHLDYQAHHHSDTDSIDSDSKHDENPVEKKETDPTCDDTEEIVPEVINGIPAERDIEATAAAKLEKTKTGRSSKSARDPNLVTWDGPDDPNNPKNWPFKRKWAAAAIVSFFTFISPVASSMVAPSLSTIKTEFNISSEVESQLVLSIFVLAYAIGPLFLGPLSEVYGRVIVLQLGNLWFMAWNLGCGFAQNSSQMLAFRFMSGLGGSAPLAIGGGVLSDCFRPEQRGRAVSVYSLAPLLGPAVAPIAGGFITENTTWRWSFWSTTMLCGVIQILGLFFLQETYAPKLLQTKAAHLRRATNNPALHTDFDAVQNVAQKLAISLPRPFILLATQPIVQVLALYMAYLYGIMYLVLSTFPTLWTQTYRQTTGISGLNYISLGLGFFLGSQITAPINDAIYRRLKARTPDQPGRPEFRAPIMIPGAFLVPAGLFLYGWAAHFHTHWILPNLGACLLSAGVIVGFQGVQTYIIDAYTRYAASAIAAATVLRSLAGFGFPLFAPYLYGSLGYGWGNSLLGFVAVVLGIPAPFLLWVFGERLRGRSRYAAGG